MGSGYKDGGLGLAPGENGFKSYIEYLIERKMVTKNTVKVRYNASDASPPLVYLGLETDETVYGEGVNYLPSSFGSNDSV